MQCSACDATTTATAALCAACGIDFRPESDHDFYQSAIGPRGSKRYIPVFEKFDEQGNGSPTWHWPAFFLNFVWLLYRKMYVSATVFLAIPMLGVIFQRAAVGSITPHHALQTFAITYIVSACLLATFADSLYHEHVNALIEVIERKRHTSRVERLNALARCGQTNSALKMAIVFVCAGCFVNVAGILPISLYKIPTSFPVHGSRILTAELQENTHEAVPS